VPAAAPIPRDDPAERREPAVFAVAAVLWGVTAARLASELWDALSAVGPADARFVRDRVSWGYGVLFALALVQAGVASLGWARSAAWRPATAVRLHLLCGSLLLLPALGVVGLASSFRHAWPTALLALALVPCLGAAASYSRRRGALPAAWAMSVATSALGLFGFAFGWISTAAGFMA
jgi:hypothetical protein